MFNQKMKNTKSSIREAPTLKFEVFVVRAGTVNPPQQRNDALDFSGTMIMLFFDLVQIEII